jgi:hypothetical protein
MVHRDAELGEVAGAPTSLVALTSLTGDEGQTMVGAVIQRYFAGLPRNTFLVAFASFFADISTEMLYPVLRVFLTQTL